MGIKNYKILSFMHSLLQLIFSVALKCKLYFNHLLYRMLRVPDKLGHLIKT